MIMRHEKLVFVHIQKTGGSAIADALGQEQNPPEKHFRAQELRELYGKHVWDSSYRFAFIRNPWARLVSWWAMIDARRPNQANGPHGEVTTGDLAKAMWKFVSDPVLAAAFREGAHKAFSKFHMDRMLNEFADMFGGLLGKAIAGE